MKDKKSELNPQISNPELLLTNLQLKGRTVKISVPTFDGLQMIKAEEIIMCLADESYTEITLACGNKIVASRLLKEYENLLSDVSFFRINNSCLINLIHVDKYIKGEGGQVLLTNGKTVGVSRRKSVNC